MSNKKSVFSPGDIMLPRQCDMTAYSVVACDQYTAEPAYWDEVKAIVGKNPSTLNMVFPEIYLKSGNFEQTIAGINAAMDSYLASGVFAEHKNTYIYVKRTLPSGTVRHGIVGIVDLEQYDYSVGSQSAIRATEGTVLDRIPPRVLIRKDASLELPHVMLLVDDINDTVLKPLKCINDADLSALTAYDFSLMQQSGSIKGYFVPSDVASAVDDALCSLGNRDTFDAKYNISGDDKGVLLFAVGDGNHSLATARQCYLNAKSDPNADPQKSRYALVEVVNLHDSSLEFEAIHRVMFDVSQSDVMQKLSQHFVLSETAGAQKLDVVIGEQVKTIYITNPKLNLCVGSLQEFIDSYLASSSGEVDYIHGADVVKSLCKKHQNSIGFILPSMDKQDLFKTVILDGALPRKTFSMGEACDKRFYLEARKIK